MNQATNSIIVVNIATTIKASNAIAMIAGLTIVIETLNATIALDATIRTQRATSPMTRRIIASTITPRKRAMWPCIMTSPLCGAWENVRKKESFSFKISFALLFLFSVLLLLKQQELQQPPCGSSSR
jgi:hypothetical protein